MPYPEQHYRWTWDFVSPPDALWPLVSNTDRFNHDCGYPPVRPVAPPAGETARAVTNARRLRADVLGVPIEWDELAFEWVAPERFGVERTYYRGPLARMVVQVELMPLPAGGTRLTYEMRVTPSNLVGRLSVPFSIGRRARQLTERVFRRYDDQAQRGLRRSAVVRRPELAPGGAERLDRIARSLVTERSQPAPLVAALQEFLGSADDLSVSRIRPYALADEWRAARPDTLQLFLHSTRAGLLDFSWDLVCPHCRGAKASSSSLSGVRRQAHCDSCKIDFTVNFDQSVELTFLPNAAIRPVTRVEYCVGGPQVTPHIIAQRRLASGTRQAVRMNVVPGRYRIRTQGDLTPRLFRVDPHGSHDIDVHLQGGTSDEPALAPGGQVTLLNDSTQPQLALIEHLAWTDQATTAAEVTSLQLFRDLFSREVLRPGEQISVGTMTIVFTDLKNSTQMYQDIGDAPAFGRVLTHFEILKAAVAAEQGGIVKTMGDAIMAVFPRPLSAVRAMLHAQRWLAQPDAFNLPAEVSVPPCSLQPLALKAGIHTGPCLAINQNDRLDYFGTTVNTAARLCAQCTGADVVLSATVADDAEVQSFLASANAPATRAEKVRLKGLGDAAIDIRRLEPRPA